jgi:hypothetical protein
MSERGHPEHKKGTSPLKMKCLNVTLLANALKAMNKRSSLN